MSHIVGNSRPRLVVDGHVTKKKNLMKLSISRSCFLEGTSRFLTMFLAELNGSTTGGSRCLPLWLVSEFFLRIYKDMFLVLHKGTLSYKIWGGAMYDMTILFYIYILQQKNMDFKPFVKEQDPDIWNENFCQQRMVPMINTVLFMLLYDVCKIPQTFYDSPSRKTTQKSSEKGCL